jgi:hypothetical protein
VTVYETADVADVEVHNELANMTANSRTIRWERIVLVNPDSLASQVCDPNACYASWISTRTFTLAANDTVPMIIHLLNPESLDPYYAVIQIKYTDLADSLNPQYSYYIYNIGTVGADEPLPAANVTLYPNPVVESFSLDNADAVSRIRVFSLDGRQVAVLNASAGQTYPLVGQPAGSYIVGLEGKSGKIFQMIKVRKN